MSNLVVKEVDSRYVGNNYLEIILTFKDEITVTDMDSGKFLLFYNVHNPDFYKNDFLNDDRKFNFNNSGVPIKKNDDGTYEARVIVDLDSVYEIKKDFNKNQVINCIKFIKDDDKYYIVQGLTIDDIQYFDSLYKINKRKSLTLFNQ